MAAAPVFTGIEFSSAHPLEDWVGAQVDAGYLPATHRDGVLNLMPEGRIAPLALALAETYTYGQTLAADFDRLIGLGFSLERVKKKSTTYDRLQALFFVKHELIELAFQEFERGLVDELSSLDQIPDGMYSGAFANSVVTKRRNAFVEQIRAAVSSRTPDSRYATLALDEIETDLEDAVSGVTLSCSPNLISTKTLEAEAKRIGERNLSLDAIKVAVRSLKKDPGAFKYFQPKKGVFGFNVEAMVKIRAAESKREELEAANDRVPQGTSPFGKLIYPNEDPTPRGPGNIFGNTFPKGAWALTFDDGPLSPLTQHVLENLDRHKMKATFFILSQQISKKDCKGIGPRISSKRPKAVWPDLARRELAEDHNVASHSYYHSQAVKASPEELRCEIVTAVDEFKEVTGERPEFFRLPYGGGVSVRKIRKVIADAGMVHVHWTVDTLDWNDKDPDSIYRRALAQMKVGRGIILFHDVHPQSVIASEMVMKYLKDPANHLRTVTIHDIVAEINGVTPAKNPSEKKAESTGFQN